MALSVVSSCQKEIGPEYDFFISKEKVLSYTETDIDELLDFAILVYPEIAAIKPYATGGVDVYKMVCHTEVGGENIEASGLVCMPSVKGKYPVLSFQNGTNTRHSDAPTAKPEDLSYKLVETLSSLGFIVLLPDYPGFGSSSDIPHPYLIAEPTVRSIVDMFRAVGEAVGTEFPGINVENEYYLLGYSQGGWATLTLHEALENDYSAEFNLAASACGAGSYNMHDLFITMINTDTYPMPAYLGYIIHAYSSYDQFTNTVLEILNDEYAGKLNSLYNGTMSTGQINSQLTTSIAGLFRPEFLSGFTSSENYSSVRNALLNNSIAGYMTQIPLLMAHGQSDTSVPVEATERMYNAMITAGTSSTICRKIIFPGLDHEDGLIPSMIEGITFILDVRDNQ